MLAGNIIDHPEEEKYRQFKPTNTAVRKKIVDPKGSLEYAVEVRAASSRLSHPSAHPIPPVYPVRIQARGKLEPVLASAHLGTHPSRQVIDFQPYYIFHKSHWNDLLIGHAVLKEFEEREAERGQRLAKAREEEKAAIEAQKEKVEGSPEHSS